jgi:hypothetical protein
LRFPGCRLASHSVVPTTLANTVLTLGAGLPFLVEGTDPGLRAAAYGPAGWLPMGIGLVLLLTTRLRHEIRIPAVEFPDQKTRVWLVVLPESKRLTDRTLH